MLEIQGSYKIGKMMPGTLIPVLEESKLFADQPEYALLFSWHIADELDPEAAAEGLHGQVHRAAADAADCLGLPFEQRREAIRTVHERQEEHRDMERVRERAAHADHAAQL